MSKTHRCSFSHQRPEHSRCRSDSGNCRWCFYTFRLSRGCLSSCTRSYLQKKMADETQQLKESQQSLAGGGCTFEEGSAVEEVAPVRETWAKGAELVVRRGASLGAFVTFRAPGHTHRAAAGIHPVSPWDGSATALVLVSQVTVLRTQICKPRDANISDDVQTPQIFHTNGAHQCTSGRWHQQSFQEGTCRRRSPVCWCTRRWCTL